MFKKSRTTSQMDLFSSPEMFLGKRAVKSYSDPKGWHNVFFDMVTSKIDEGIFSVLYKSGNMRAPTAPVRILVAMSISPSLDTYYLFNRRLCDYADKTGVDLMERCFEHITGQQVKRLKAGVVTLRDKKEIKSDSVQNPNDPDAHYRNKGDQKVRGYSTNITETVEDNKPCIITSVQVEGASASDCNYVKGAIDKTERVTGETVENHEDKDRSDAGRREIYSQTDCRWRGH